MCVCVITSVCNGAHNILLTLCVYGAHTILLYIVCCSVVELGAILLYCVLQCLELGAILLHCVLQCCRARCHLATLCVAVL